MGEPQVSKPTCHANSLIATNSAKSQLMSSSSFGSLVVVSTITLPRTAQTATLIAQANKACCCAAAELGREANYETVSRNSYVTCLRRRCVRRLAAQHVVRLHETFAAMIVAPAVLDHVQSIASIHVRSWQSAYTNIVDARILHGMSIENRIQSWRAILVHNESQTLVATVDGQVLGFVSFGECRDQDASFEDAEIWALYVDPKMWRQGIGRALMRRAIQELRDRGKSKTLLWVFSRNLRGIGFYQALGFVRLAGSEKTFDLGGCQVEEVCMVLRHGD